MKDITGSRDSRYRRGSAKWGHVLISSLGHTSNINKIK
jgi:hypothetical protein